jgi:aldehyde dehydrogenase (NAD+)
VVAFIPYTDKEDAIANDSAFGLHGTVWTSDVEKGQAVTQCPAAALRLVD